MSAPHIRVRVTVEGGLVSSIVSDAPDRLELVVIDYDNDEEDALCTAFPVELNTDPAFYREGAP